MQAELSTVAYSVYNALAVRCDGPATPEFIVEILRVGWLRDVTEPVVVTALQELVVRGLLVALDDGLFDLRDTQRRAVMERVRAGDGWDGWRLEARPGTLRAKLARLATVPIEAVTR